MQICIVGEVDMCTQVLWVNVYTYMDIVGEVGGEYAGMCASRALALRHCHPVKSPTGFQCTCASACVYVFLFVCVCVPLCACVSHTSYLSRTPRVYSCNFFLAGVDFYRFNAKNWQFTVYFVVIYAFFWCKFYFPKILPV